MTVPAIKGLEPCESFEVSADLSLLPRWRLRLWVPVRRGESHPYLLGDRDLFIGEFPCTELNPQAGDPEANTPTKPYFVGLRVRVSVIAGI
jgi:hypothetical protein